VYTFELGAGWKFAAEYFPKLFGVCCVCQSAVMLVFHIGRFEGLCLEYQFEEEASDCKNIDLIGLIHSFAAASDKFRGIAFERPHGIGVIVLDRVLQLIHEVSGVAEIYNFHVEFGIQ
jgi:hypothetical protein